VTFLTQHAFISPEALLPRLKRVQGAEDDVEQRLIDSINAATHWMELVTRRGLKARNHRSTSTLTATVTDSDTQVIGNSFNTLERGDDISGNGVNPGSQIGSIDSPAILQMTRKGNQTVFGSSLTFGSRPLRFSGDGTNEAWLSERPLVEVFSLYSVASDGTQTEIDTTGARYNYELGRIVLGQDVFPSGVLNIAANVRCGYEQPEESRLGSPDWYTLEQLAMRAAEVFFMDGLQIRGRAEDVTLSSMSSRVAATPMPADLIAGVQAFYRRW
jgi:hypothetical protein